MARHPADLMAVMRIAQSGSREGVDLEVGHSLEEMEDYVSSMKKLMQVRDTILRVNREYIRSAAMDDAYRTEPPFRMQGSYRNMNRIAERIVPMMTDGEVVPVREGESDGADVPLPEPKKKRIRGKSQGLPVDVESEVDQPPGD